MSVKKSYDLIKIIHDANLARNMDNLPRRVIKLSEETGEASEAFLYASTPNSRKNITWDDFREEAVDTAIVGLDLALTTLPIDEGKTSEQIQQEVIEVFEQKLKKWKLQLSAGTDATL